MSPYEIELAKILNAEIDRLKDILAAGTAITKKSEYRHVVGQIRAYHQVLNEYMDEASAEMNKR